MSDTTAYLALAGLRRVYGRQLQDIKEFVEALKGVVLWVVLCWLSWDAVLDRPVPGLAHSFLAWLSWGGALVLMVAFTGLCLLGVRALVLFYAQASSAYVGPSRAYMATLAAYEAAHGGVPLRDGVLMGFARANPYWLQLQLQCPDGTVRSLGIREVYHLLPLPRYRLLRTPLRPAAPRQQQRYRVVASCLPAMA